MTDSPTFFWIKNLVTLLITDTIQKWVDNCLPFRMVMIRSNYCYICETSSTTVRVKQTDDYDGKYNHYGWLYCSSCKTLKDCALKHYEKQLTYLTYSQTNILCDKVYQFWRISSNPNIQPYIQKNCELYITNLVCLSRGTERLCTPISWIYRGEELNKYIFLSNLIHFNRKHFSYTRLEFGTVPVTHKWIKRISREYQIANIWSTMVKILVINYIPNAIIREICYVWGGFTSSTF